MKEIIFGTINSAKLYAIRHSDKILLTLGIACTGGAVVSAAKSSMKLNDKLKDCNDRIARIKSQLNNSSDIANGIVDVSIKKKELTREYLKVAGEIGKLYALPTVLFVSGVGMICGSHHIMQQRLASTTALLTLTKNQFDAYRDRVKEIVGDEKELAIYNNQTEKEVETVDKNGKKVKQTVLVSNGDSLGYNQVLWGRDTVSTSIKLDPDNLIVQLDGIQQRLSYLLRSRGYLFLEDVYFELGIDLYTLGDEEKLLAIKNVGWVYDPMDPEINDFVDFGLRDANGNLTRDAKELDLGVKDNIVLTFNCAGDIVNGIRKYPNYMGNKRGWRR